MSRTKDGGLVGGLKERAIRWLEDNRGLVIVLFCLPASFLFDLGVQLKCWFQRTFRSAPADHPRRVQRIQEAVRKWNEQPAAERKPMTNATRSRFRSTTSFHLDEERLVVRVEPNVTVRDLTRFLTPKGYTLAVTLEIGDATAGGLAFGVGMTTYSHKVGLYQETVLSYDLVTASGELIHVHSQAEYCEKMMELSGAKDKDFKTPDFLEATIYSRENAVIMVGNFEDADTKEKQKKVSDEFVPIADYLLRHNRAIFWVVESMIPFGNHPLFRLLLGWLCPPKPAFLKFTTTRAIREMTFAKQVFQDIVYPLAMLKEQVDTATELFDTFPLCSSTPCRIYDHRRGPQGQLRPPPHHLLTPGTNYAMFNDLGVYGTPGPVKRREPYNPTKAMREMEKFTRDAGGYSFLYADIFHDRAGKYAANGAFPSLYEKIKPEIDVIAIGNEYAQ
ncbi:hypothetical protein M3Y99_01875100 [Aphelenchoides fujianensis]|nr:hypothetical protein M3Y99_01875100 [Aphelenchoides fujianensis]